MSRELFMLVCSLIPLVAGLTLTVVAFCKAKANGGDGAEPWLAALVAGALIFVIGMALTCNAISDYSKTLPSAIHQAQGGGK